MTARGERETHQTHCVFLNPRLYNTLLQTRYTEYIYLLTVDRLLTATLTALYGAALYGGVLYGGVLYGGVLF